MPYLTPREESWLERHGGRTNGDVLVDEKGRKFVLMRDGANHADERVYLDGKAKDDETV